MWTAGSSNEEIKFVPNELRQNFSSPLVGKLVEHIKRAGKDGILDMELFDELYQLEDSRLKAIFKEVSKISFRASDGAPVSPSSFYPKLDWQCTRITSRGAQLYRPHYVHCVLRVKRPFPGPSTLPWGILEDWLPKGLQNQVGIYFVLPSRFDMQLEAPKLDLFFSFTFFSPNMRFKHVGLVSVTGYRQEPRYFFKPIILDISNDDFQISSSIPRTFSSETASSSSSASLSTKKVLSKKESFLKSETGAPIQKQLAPFILKFPSHPPIWNAISASESEILAPVAINVAGEWS